MIASLQTSRLNDGKRFHSVQTFVCLLVFCFTKASAEMGMGQNISWSNDVNLFRNEPWQLEKLIQISMSINSSLCAWALLDSCRTIKKLLFSTQLDDLARLQPRHRTVRQNCVHPLPRINPGNPFFTPVQAYLAHNPFPPSLFPC